MLVRSNYTNQKKAEGHPNCCHAVCMFDHTIGPKYANLNPKATAAESS